MDISSCSLSELELVSPLVVESKLRASVKSEYDANYPASEESVENQYILSNCPRFDNFRKNFADESGKGIDIQCTIVHQEYISLIEEQTEQKIFRYLFELKITEKKFVEATANIVNAKNVDTNTDSSSQDAMTNLINHFANKYQDFEMFGNFMEDEFIKHFIKNDTSYSTVNEIGESKQVRVLWDIENVCVPKRIGGMETVTRLIRHLTKENLAGPGIDCRITAFFNPQKNTLSENCMAQLDAAGVELLWISPKREEADRRLVNRIQQEIQVLKKPNLESHASNAAAAAFVLITSDKDFRSQIQLLSSAGYHVYIIHQAQNPNWAQALELHALKGYNFAEIVGEPLELENPSSTQNQIIELNVGNNKIKGLAAKMNSEIVNAPFSTDQPAILTLPLLGGEKITVSSSRIYTDAIAVPLKAICLRWKGAFGFLAVAVPAVQGEVVVSYDNLPQSNSGNKVDYIELMGLKILKEGRADVDTDTNTDTNTNTNTHNSSRYHLVKVYANYSTLRLKPKRKFLSRHEICMVSVVPASKGPRTACVWKGEECPRDENVSENEFTINSGERGRIMEEVQASLEKYIHPGRGHNNTT